MFSWLKKRLWFQATLGILVAGIFFIVGPICRGDWRLIVSVIFPPAREWKYTTSTFPLPNEQSLLLRADFYWENNQGLYAEIVATGRRIYGPVFIGWCFLGCGGEKVQLELLFTEDRSLALLIRKGMPTTAFLLLDLANGRYLASTELIGYSKMGNHSLIETAKQKFPEFEQLTSLGDE